MNKSLKISTLLANHGNTNCYRYVTSEACVFKTANYWIKRNILQEKLVYINFYSFVVQLDTKPLTIENTKGIDMAFLDGQKQ